MLAGTANSAFATRSSPPDRFRPGPIAVVTAPTRAAAANCKPPTVLLDEPSSWPACGRGRPDVIAMESPPKANVRFACDVELPGPGSVAKCPTFSCGELKLPGNWLSAPSGMLYGTWKSTRVVPSVAQPSTVAHCTHVESA